MESIYKQGLTKTDYIGNLTGEGYVVVGTYLTSVGFLAILANVFVIYASLKYKIYIGRHDVLLVVNMAVSDLIISVSGHPMVASSSFAGYWLFGDHGCIFFAFMYFTLSMVSMNSLVAIGVFRYILICKPQYYTLLSTTNTKRVIFGCWVYAVLCTAPPLFGWSSFTYESFGTSCSMNWLGKSALDITYIAFTIIFCFLGHVAILIVCYSKISRGAQGVAVQVFRELRTQPRRMLEQMSDLRAVTLVSFVEVIAFLLAWTPYAVISVLQIWVYVKPELAILPTMGAKLTCITNPLIISLFTNRYRKLYWAMMYRCFFKEEVRTNVVTPMQQQRQQRRRHRHRGSGVDVYSIELGERLAYQIPGHSHHSVHYDPSSVGSLNGSMSDDGIIRYHPNRTYGGQPSKPTAVIKTSPTGSSSLSNESRNCYEHLHSLPRQYMALEPADLQANLALAGLPDVNV